MSDKLIALIIIVCFALVCIIAMVTICFLRNKIL